MNKPYFEQTYGDGEMGWCDNPECCCHSNILAEDVYFPVRTTGPRYPHWPKKPPLTRWQKFKLFFKYC